MRRGQRRHLHPGIWDFTKSDALWRLVASFLVVAAGTGLFSAVNTSFGDENQN